MINLSKALPCIILLACHGCLGKNPSDPSSPSSTTAQTNDSCPDQPKDILESKNVRSMSFANESATASAQLRSGESLGYKFQGEVGKVLNFSTKQEICIWVYTPTNKIIKDLKLTETGQYIVQVSAQKGTQTFTLDLKLSDPKTAQALPSPSSQKLNKSTQIPPTSTPKPSQSFSKSNFPKAACGDEKPSAPSLFPVTFYPVNVPDSESNLNQVRSKFCADSYRKKSKDTGEKVIQVASFINEQDAKTFADLVRSEISGAMVGSSTIVESP